jgi:hypothetical protein
MPNVDVCSYLENAAVTSLFASGIKFVNSTFPGMVHKCPYKVRKSLSLTSDDIS